MTRHAARPRRRVQAAMTGKEVESAGQAHIRFDAHADDVANVTAYVRLRQGQAGIQLRKGKATTL